MRGAYELVAGPASEPVTLAEAKEHCRIDGTADDDYVAALITAAREMVTRLTGRALITESWKLVLDCWPSTNNDEWWDGVREAPITVLEAGQIELHRAPFLALTSVKTFDESNAETVWASSNYYTSSRHGYGRLIKRRGSVWPIPDRDVAGIEIAFTIGYGPGAAAVPSALRQAIKMLVLHWYDNRMPASECASSELMPMGLGSILSAYRVMR